MLNPTGRPYGWLSSAASALYGVEGFFSAAECAQILAEAEGGFDRVGLINNTDVGDIRRSNVAWLDDEGPSAWVMTKLMKLVSEVNGSHFHFNLTDFLERIQIAEYDQSNAGHYDWHTDLGSSTIASKRKLTLVAQLSDPADYVGGLLELNIGGHVVQAPLPQGSCFLFPAFIVHRVSPVSQGRRHSLACWVHGPTFS